jgi:uncharacterized membrane protein YfcA
MLLQHEVDARRLRQSRDAAKARGVTVFGSGVAGAVIGLLGGLVGISGGFIAVPVLVTYQGLQIHRAVATSWMIITLVSASATAGHFLAGQRVSLGDTLLFLIGGVIGFEVAVRVAHRFSEGGLRRTFGVAIVMMGIVMLVRLVAG